MNAFFSASVHVLSRVSCFWTGGGKTGNIYVLPARGGDEPSETEILARMRLRTVPSRPSAPEEVATEPPSKEMQ